MPAVIKYPNAGALLLAGWVKTQLAACEIHLFKDGAGIVVGPTLTLAELAAAEADFTGYAFIPVAAMSNPLLNPVGGASISTGTQQFAITAPYTVPNVIAGGWIQDSAGNLLMAWSYENPVSLVGAGDGLPVEQILVYG